MAKSNSHTLCWVYGCVELEISCRSQPTLPWWGEDKNRLWQHLLDTYGRWKSSRLRGLVVSKIKLCTLKWLNTDFVHNAELGHQLVSEGLSHSTVISLTSTWPIWWWLRMIRVLRVWMQGVYYTLLRVVVCTRSPNRLLYAAFIEHRLMEEFAQKVSVNALLPLYVLPKRWATCTICFWISNQVRLNDLLKRPYFRKLLKT